ncbi:hypothetical protein B0T24DRAFT_608186 [Lasiosphaeria ovina]|uniref:Transmembrane protein n=1 Tax=Lasiosphaeria ovina TaxID=92902 RepID=A0AAE0NMU4_9PEZI|nr:hypothetical protein B0T24DRAFT_608186 [Lasiosphaeria ovina]
MARVPWRFFWPHALINNFPPFSWLTFVFALMVPLLVLLALPIVVSSFSLAARFAPPHRDTLANQQQKQNGFQGRVWKSKPPQNKRERK